MLRNVMQSNRLGAHKLTPTEINGLVLTSQSFDVSLQVSLHLH